MRRLAVAASVALFLGGIARAQDAFKWRRQPNEAFAVGETILYVIKYGFISAGHASMEVKSTETVGGRAAYHILSRASTNKAMDVAFKVRDVNESWIDVESLCSLRYYQLIREGLYRREVRADFHHPEGRFVYWKRRKGKESTVEGGIPAYVQDVLSSLYYVRTQDLEAGQDIFLDANSGAKSWPLRVHVKEVETVRVPAGKFECYHVEPILAGEGIFQQSGRLEVWLTRDERKIPVLLRSKVLLGAFDAEMERYSAVPGDAGMAEELRGIFGEGALPDSE